MSGAAGLFGWDGEQADAETGLTYLRARYYSPVFGQFLSRDPLMSGSGTQRSAYVFASDNPATLGDPSGLSPSGGSGIAGAFWLLAYALECGVVGECRYHRRHAGGSSGADLGSVSGGGDPAPINPFGGPARPAFPRPIEGQASGNQKSCSWCPVPTDPGFFFRNPPFLKPDEGVVGLCAGGAVNVPGIAAEGTVCIVSDRHGNYGVSLTIAQTGIATITIVGGSITVGGLVSTADSIYELRGWAATGGIAGISGAGDYANVSVAQDSDGELEVTFVDMAGIGLEIGVEGGGSYTMVCKWNHCPGAISSFVLDKFPSKPKLDWPWNW